MLNGLTPTWFLKPPFDLEHKQYVLLAYIRDANKTFDANKLTPYFDDVRAQLKNIECYSSIRGLLKRDGDEFTKDDLKMIDYVANLPDSHPDRKEVDKVVKWSIGQLKDLQRRGSDVWKHIENCLAMSFIGQKPRKVRGGYMFIRYPGSWIVETYKFWVEKDRVCSEFIGFDENKSPKYTDVMVKYSGVHEDYAYISVEPTKPFDTKDGLLPVVHQVLKSKVISKTSEADKADERWRME